MKHLFAKTLTIAAVFVPMIGSTHAASANDALLKTAEAAICGPERKGISLNGHDFNVKEATIGVDARTDLTIVAAGQISHRLRLVPDDQIYYTINYKNGVPDPAKTRVDRGGFAAYLDLIADAMQFVGLAKLKIAGTEISLKPEKLPEIATELSKLVHGSGWEEQAAAMVAFIGVAATLPVEEVCEVVSAPSGGGGSRPGGGGPRGDGPPIQVN